MIGYLAFIKELNHVSKLGDRSMSGVFIGYVKGSKLNRILDLETRWVRTVRDVVFDEFHSWDWSKRIRGDMIVAPSDFTIDYI